MARYRDNCPLRPLYDNSTLARRSAAELMTFEYFAAVPGTLEPDVYERHHILINVEDRPIRIETWRQGEHREFLFGGHQLMVTPAGMEAGWRWHTASDVITVTLEPERLRRFAEAELGVALTAEQLRDLPQIEDPELSRAARQLGEALQGDELGSEVIFESLARVFLTKLIGRYAETTGADLKFVPGFTARHYQRVFDFVAAHYPQTVTVDAMAKEAGLSTFHFARTFKDVVGQTPHQFLTAYRVERAREHLADPEIGLAAIAQYCGFSDQSHLSRVFKQVIGLTPSVYRREQAARGHSTSSL